MHFQYPISASVLFCLLLVAAVGCGAGKVPEQGAPTETTQADSPEMYYEQLLRKRLELQEKIYAAMDLYRETDDKVHEQQVLLRQYLGQQPDEETIELFSKGQVRDIPQNLRAAYSCWRTQIPLRTRLAVLAKWLDDRQVAGELESLDYAIMDVENRQHLGRFYSPEELNEIDRLLAQQVVGFETVEVANTAILEEEAIQQMINELENWK